MVILSVISLIYHHLVVVMGTVVVICAVAAVVAAIVEQAGYARKIREAKEKRKITESRGLEDVEIIENESKIAGGNCRIDADSTHIRRTRRVAIITGASSGIGQKYAKMVDAASEKYNVNEIWLIARRKDRLMAMAKSLHLPAKVFPIDLTDGEKIEKLRRYISETAGSSGEHYAAVIREPRELGEATGATEDGTEHGVTKDEFEVTLLINCAGYGKYGTSAEIGHAEECRIIDVNDKAAIAITDIVRPYMRKGGRIAQICSVAAFQPIPGLNAYAASKALLYSYSRGLRIELLSEGISVTAVCPYWVYDTEFIETAAVKTKKPFLASRVASVARWSLYDIRHRYALSTPGIMSTADRIIAKLVPDELLALIMKAFL